MVNSTIVRGDIVCIEEDSFLYCCACQQRLKNFHNGYTHLLKLVTGVDISTRPVNKFGRPGNEVKRMSRKAAAAPKSAAFRRSIFISNLPIEEKRSYNDGIDSININCTATRCSKTRLKLCPQSANKVWSVRWRWQNFFAPEKVAGIETSPRDRQHHFLHTPRNNG